MAEEHDERAQVGLESSPEVMRAQSEMVAARERLLSWRVEWSELMPRDGLKLKLRPPNEPESTTPLL